MIRARLPAKLHDPVQVGLLGLVPLLVAGWAAASAFSNGFAGGDFRNWLIMVHGHAPYAWTTADRAAGLSFPYPAFTWLMLQPFTGLSPTAAGVLAMLACLLALAGAMRVLGVRDWRIYGVLLLWSPVIVGWRTGNLTLPLALGLALLWRWRDRPAAVGALAGLMISVKPTMFPVALWLIGTRRYRGLAWTAITGLSLNAIAWSVLGWNELRPWLHLVSLQSRELYRTGYSVIAFLAHLGVGRSAASAVQIALSLAVAAGCLVLARRHREKAAYGLACVLALVASPLIDQHYFALLVVPLALVLPRLAWLWILPVVLWVCPATGGPAWQVGVWMISALILTIEILRRSSEPAPVQPGVPDARVRQRRLPAQLPGRGVLAP